MRFLINRLSSFFVSVNNSAEVGSLSLWPVFVLCLGFRIHSKRVGFIIGTIYSKASFRTRYKEPKRPKTYYHVHATTIVG